MARERSLMGACLASARLVLCQSTSGSALIPNISCASEQSDVAIQNGQSDGGRPNCCSPSPRKFTNEINVKLAKSLDGIQFHIARNKCSWQFELK
jgi:hypothetical protein